MIDQLLVDQLLVVQQLDDHGVYEATLGQIGNETIDVYVPPGLYDIFVYVNDDGAVESDLNSGQNDVPIYKASDSGAYRQVCVGKCTAANFSGGNISRTNQPTNQ